MHLNLIELNIQARLVIITSEEKGKRKFLNAGIQIVDRLLNGVAKTIRRKSQGILEENLVFFSTNLDVCSAGIWVQNLLEQQKEIPDDGFACIHLSKLFPAGAEFLSPRLCQRVHLGSF